MADDPREHEDKDDDHSGDHSKRYDHNLPLFSVGALFIRRTALDGIQHSFQVGVTLRAQLERLS